LILGAGFPNSDALEISVSRAAWPQRHDGMSRYDTAGPTAPTDHRRRRQEVHQPADTKSTMKRNTTTTACAAILLGALALGARAQEPVLYVYSTIDALLAGAYDGDLTVRQLASKGDFGLGTYNHLNGEMVVLGGTFFHVKANGQVAVADPDEHVPLAYVLPFKPSDSFVLDTPATAAKPLAELEAAIDARLPNKNLFYAVKVAGSFTNVATRAIAPQVRPYRPLAEVSKEQVVFKRTETVGSLVGLRSPGFSKGISVPGWHWHFISDGKDYGGHVLSGSLVHGVVQVAAVHELDVQLPANEDFSKADQTKDRSAELHQVESDKR
jgi:acetolactate decarboxylase